MFFGICEYFEITPQDFFSAHDANPQKSNRMIQNIHRLDSESIAYVNGIISKLAEK
jgi:16S rRNA C967 or C1407 C5-methylase (RsmB/RsmF family)